MKLPLFYTANENLISLEGSEIYYLLKKINKKRDLHYNTLHINVDIHNRILATSKEAIN